MCENSTGPGQNFVYGDAKGNIGYWCGVMLPIRSSQQSTTLPLPGWTKETEWQGFIPFEELPHLFNPPEGFIATANNKIVDDSYPYHISDLWEPPSRIQRLARSTEQGRKFDQSATLSSFRTISSRSMRKSLLHISLKPVTGRSSAVRRVGNRLFQELEFFIRSTGRRHGTLSTVPYAD